MKTLFTILSFAIIGAFCALIGAAVVVNGGLYTIPYSSGDPLQAGPVLSTPMHTVIVVHNHSRSNITISEATFLVKTEDFVRYKPSETPDWSGPEIVFEKTLNKGEDLDRKFTPRQLDITIPAKSMVAIRLRLSNHDYPELRGTGKVTLKYNNHTLEISGVPLSVESWHW